MISLLTNTQLTSLKLFYLFSIVVWFVMPMLQIHVAGSSRELENDAYYLILYYFFYFCLVPLCRSDM